MQKLKDFFIFSILIFLLIFILWNLMSLEFPFPSLKTKPKYNFIFYEVNGNVNTLNFNFKAKTLKLNRETKIIMENFSCFNNKNTFSIFSEKAIILNGNLIKFEKPKTQIKIRR